MVLNVDDAIPEPALDEIRAIDGIATSFCVSLPDVVPAIRPRPALV